MAEVLTREPVVASSTRGPSAPPPGSWSWARRRVLRGSRSAFCRLPGLEEHVRVHVTGCPNSCGQHWISDIGIEGKKMKGDGRIVDAYYFCVGGAVGKHQAVARHNGYRVPARHVPEAVDPPARVPRGPARRADLPVPRGIEG